MSGIMINPLLLLFSVSVFLLTSCGGGEANTPPVFDTVPGDILIEIHVAEAISKRIALDQTKTPSPKHSFYNWNIVFDKDFSGQISVDDLEISVYPKQENNPPYFSPQNFEYQIFRIADVSENGYSKIHSSTGTPVIFDKTVYILVNSIVHPELSELNNSIPVSFNAMSASWVIFNSERVIAQSFDYYPSGNTPYDTRSFFQFFTQTPDNGTLTDDKNEYHNYPFEDIFIPLSPIADLKTMKVLFY